MTLLTFLRIVKYGTRLIVVMTCYWGLNLPCLESGHRYRVCLKSGEAESQCCTSNIWFFDLSRNLATEDALLYSLHNESTHNAMLAEQNRIEQNRLWMRSRAPPIWPTFFLRDYRNTSRILMQFWYILSNKYVRNLKIGLKDFDHERAGSDTSYHAGISRKGRVVISEAEGNSETRTMVLERPTSSSITPNQ